MIPAHEQNKESFNMSHDLRHDSQSITRRQFTLGAALAGATLALPQLRSRVAAQQGDLASLGLPTLDITITTDTFDGLPESLEAGRYLLNVTAEGLKEGGAVAFVQPYQMSGDDFIAFIGGGAPAGASPTAGGEDGGEEEGPLPTFTYQSKFAGGALAGPDMPGMAVIDLTEGEWVAWGDDPEATQAPMVVTVTGEFPVDASEPDADVMATLVDFGIMVEGNLTAGERILRVENVGAQPHFLELSTVPAGTTNDDLTALLNGFMTGTPAAVDISEDDFGPGTYTPTQSIGTVTWTKVSLEAGTYAAMCFFPTAGIGDPHAFHGMHTVFEVS
jgi:hypothetical protein